MNEDTLGSIWKSEFREQRDADYVILNLQVDLGVMAMHYRDLAKRMQEHFPEMAEQLMGTVQVLDEARAKLIPLPK